MMTIPNLLIQSKALATIRQLIRETAEREQDLSNKLKKSRQEAERAKTTSISECDQEHRHWRTEAEQHKEEALLEIKKRQEQEPIVLQEKHNQRIIEINTQAEDLAEQSEVKLNEAIWLAESVYEAAMPLPRKNAKEAQESIDNAKARLDALVDEAPKTLSALRQTATAPSSNEVDSSETSMIKHVDYAEKALRMIQSDPKAKWFSGYKPHCIVVITTGASIVCAGTYANWEPTLPIFLIPTITLIISILALILTFISGSNSVRKKHKEFAKSASTACQLFDRSIKQIDVKRREEEKKITATRDAEIEKAETKYKPRLNEIDRLLHNDLEKEKERFKNVESKLTQKLIDDESAAKATYSNAIETLEQNERKTLNAIDEKYATDMKTFAEEEEAETKDLKNNWDTGLKAYIENIKNQQSLVEKEHLQWNDSWEDWVPPSSACKAIPLATCEIDLSRVGGELPKSQELELPVESPLHIPICTALPDSASFLIKTNGNNRDKAIAQLQNAMMRSLTAIPPGKAKFTLIDPVGLGQSFAGVLHLADYEESQLLDRAWTEPRHIETQLARLTEHMETVIQKYLRNEFKTIDEYNQQAGEIAEPYRFLVIADLPNNFSENAAKRLASIITSGARCGVYVIIHQDQSMPLPSGIEESTLNRIQTRFIAENNHLIIDNEEFKDIPLLSITPPTESITTAIVKKVGDTAENTNRIEVPFDVIAPKEDELWSRSTTDKVAIPLGRAGASKLQNLTLGRGTAQHALIAGKTGSGKSTLLHVLITNLALWYSPEEVEFYLVDFKKGVEFKTYATHKLPHAKVVAVESDREFGISVLQRIDEELKKRGELFRDLGAQDIAGFRERSDEPMPRILLIIDEFQEFFIDDDQVAQEANLLLDRLVRQGRAFGIHAIMGSQTLDGAYTLSRSTMGQMAVRVALQCSEQDSYIILNEDNAAARLLSRPGEAIYNDAAGKVEGNSPFQIVWLDEKLRETFLNKLATKDNGESGNMVVYEGNKPVYLENNTAYKNATKSNKPLAAKAWLGGAMAIKEDTAAILRPTAASNLLIIGQQEETTTGMIGNSILSIDKQFPPEYGRFILLDGTPADSLQAGYILELAKQLQCPTNEIGIREVNTAMQSLSTELVERMTHGVGNRETIFLVINALHRYRDLRRDEDDFSFSMNNEDKPKTPAQILTDVLKEGPPLGIHVIAATDTLANLNRTFDRQAMREFDLRVLLQMGSNDSTNLIDAPNASKLGMHRALLYSEETGTIEPFRPYAINRKSEK